MVILATIRAMCYMQRMATPGTNTHKQQLLPYKTSSNSGVGQCFISNGQMGRWCQLGCPDFWNQTLNQQSHTHACRSGRAGKRGEWPSGCLSQNWQHPFGYPTLTTLLYFSCCYFHIYMFHTTTALTIQDIKQLRSRAMFYIKWPDGSLVSARVPRFLEPNSEPAKPHPFESSGQ